MTDIEQVRAVLAKWRDGTTTAPWSEVYTEFGDGIASASTGYMVASYADAGDARLIVGTAGNPDLLDAIDGLLELAIEYGALPTGSGSRFSDRTNRLAAAIIAADQRINA